MVLLVYMIIVLCILGNIVWEYFIYGWIVWFGFFYYGVCIRWCDFGNVVSFEEL